MSDPRGAAKFRASAADYFARAVAIEGQGQSAAELAEIREPDAND